LQADPVVQAPKNSQNLNRYSYVLNNPLSYTDPTGFSFFKKYWRVIAAAVAVYVTAGLATPWIAGFAWGAGAAAGTLSVAGAAVVGAITGAVGGAILTGTVKGAFYGALAGAALGAIGASGISQFGKTITGGAANGVVSELQGGKFGHGFLSAGSGMLMGVRLGGPPSFGKFMAAAIAGGTLSELTGGKFANGAMSAGLAYAVAVLASSGETQQSNDEKYGRTLTIDEKASFSDHFSSEVLDSARLYEGKVPWWLPKKMEAVTLGNKIYFREGVYVPGTADGVEVLGHELVHVQQYSEGMTILKYLWSSRKGYWENPYEIGAYARDRLIRNSFCSANPQAVGC